jgi:hypothetical protein
MPWANRQHLSNGHIFPRLYVLHVAYTGGGGGGVSAAADDAAAAQLKPDRFELREEKKLLIRIEFAACIVPAA